MAGRRLISQLRSVGRMSTAACKSVRKFSVPSPCLMLPPSMSLDEGIDFNFYSLAEKRVVTLGQAKGLNNLMPKPIQKLKICGSSHGWIALFNPDTLDLFIYNPVSLRHIKLPPIPNCPKDSEGYVTKLILSCSPEESSCRAVVIYNRVNVVAFCYPGRSNEWTPFGYKGYCDFAYSSRQNLFFGLYHPSYYYSLETWDLSDSSSPREITSVEIPSATTCPMFDVVKPIVEQCLVVTDGLSYDDQLQVLLVSRHVIPKVAPDGSFVTSPEYYPHMTAAFYTDVYDQEEGHIFQDGMGDDLALFLGSCSDSFALSTTQFPHLNSNSIYFTDNRCVKAAGKLFGGHDIGIYNFQNQTVSPCYYPCDRPNLKTTYPPTNWFFPTSF